MILIYTIHPIQCRLFARWRRDTTTTRILFIVSFYLFIYLLTLQPNEHNCTSYENKIQTYNRKKIKKIKKIEKYYTVLHWLRVWPTGHRSHTKISQSFFCYPDSHLVLVLSKELKHLNRKTNLKRVLVVVVSQCRHANIIQLHLMNRQHHITQCMLKDNNYVRMYECTNVRMYECTNVRMYECIYYESQAYCTYRL
jgi:hypothetical protein